MKIHIVKKGFDHKGYRFRKIDNVWKAGRHGNKLTELFHGRFKYSSHNKFANIVMTKNMDIANAIIEYCKIHLNMENKHKAMSQVEISHSNSHEAVETADAIAELISKEIVIKSVANDLTTRDGKFSYPKSGFVEAPDWNPEPEGGGGLHGLRAGDNCPGVWHDDGKYLALEVDSNDIIELDGKCKFPKAKVVYVADSMLELSEWLQNNGHTGPWYMGTAQAGFHGTAIAGDHGTAQAGDYGTAKAGENGIIIINNGRVRYKAGYIGENGLKPDTFYKLNNENEFEEVK